MGWIEKLKLIKDRIFGTKPKMLNAPEKMKIQILQK